MPIAKIQLDTNLPEIAEQMNELAKFEIRYAISIALNKSARRVKLDGYRARSPREYNRMFSLYAAKRGGDTVKLSINRIVPVTVRTPKKMKGKGRPEGKFLAIARKQIPVTKNTPRIAPGHRPAQLMRQGYFAGTAKKVHSPGRVQKGNDERGVTGLFKRVGANRVPVEMAYRLIREPEWDMVAAAQRLVPITFSRYLEQHLQEAENRVKTGRALGRADTEALGQAIGALRSILR